MPKFSLAAYVATTFGGADWKHFRLCGMDEVGRGAFAGPLVAAAVVLPARFRHPLLRDSKRLSAAQRIQMDLVIRKAAEVIEIVQVSAAAINTRGLGPANREVFERLVEVVDADGYCCDGRLKIAARRPVHCLVKGDDLIPAISAASIVAKVWRDRLMVELHASAPDYEWANNKGYGAPVHRAAILRVGAHPQHRRGFLTTMLQNELNSDRPEYWDTRLPRP